ncbi:WD40 repeat-like protein [Neocallimastix californiae]|uniref:WD40 repeat-like protein n=1 Tax=Neocallimastix californiae TaxID=1754190 RepID=A0A1Y1YTK4_9FUNG|nr:WD40 repeat-like protein [Neocallimastix californiae]|eukprot:ORY01368.1 WD40 repeat-like protein [Neocallimastix californiae]
MSNCTVTSDEINYLVYRYLIESGFLHTSYMFQHETHILQNSNIKTEEVKPGALIHYLQKGLLYTEVEYHASENGAERHCVVPFSLISKHHCKTEEELEDEEENESDYSNNTAVNSRQSNNKRSRKEKKDKKSEKKIKRENEDSVKDSLNESEDIEVDIENSNNESELNLISQKDVIQLNGHEEGVFVCSWNPIEPLLATGSGDGTARIWTIPTKPDDPVKLPIVLEHEPEPNQEHKDITTLAWNKSGTLLATGTYDGKTRLWTKDGELLYTMRKHTAAIFSLKWNRKGNLFLTGSVDNTAIIWDSSTGEARQQYNLHKGPVLEVDWKDDITFATCSIDKQIYVCKLGSPEPIIQFSGHEDEINIIKWDPESELLASCSDDRTACVWSMKQTTPICIFREHEKEIYTIKWCTNSKKTKILATASFDSTIRLWDVLNNTCLHVLQNHLDAVYSVSFNPFGFYLASGSLDHRLNIWSVETGELIKTYVGENDIFEVSWNEKGDKVAVCFANNVVS